MDTKELTAILVVAMVGCVIVAGFVPVVGESVSATDTLENDGYFHMEKYTADDELTIIWNPATPKQITVNDVTYRPATPINQFVNMAIGDNWYVRYADGGANTFVQVSTGAFVAIEATQNSSEPLTIECSNGTATMTLGTTVRTATYTEIYAISGDSGEYVMKNANESVYMAGNTEFIALGITALGTGRAVLKVTGNVDDGAEVEVIASQPSGATTTNIVVNATPLTNYIGYSLSTITFDIISEDVEYPATYSYFIVPATVTLEKAIHADDNTASIISMLPFILIMGIVLMFVGVVIVRRYV